MSWKDLDIKLKAELIKLGVLSGIKDIKLIRLLYDDINTPTLVVDLSYNETNVRPLLGTERIKLEYGISEELLNKANNIIQLIENEISLEEINNQLPILFRLFKNGGPIEDKRIKKYNNNSAGYLYDSFVTDNLEKGKNPHNSREYTIPEELAEKLGYYRDEVSGHRDDAVKLPDHPSHGSRGTFKDIDGYHIFDLTDKGANDVNYTISGLIDNGDDHVIPIYNGSYILPEVTVTPNGNYVHDTYNNLKWRLNKFDDGGYVLLDTNNKYPPEYLQFLLDVHKYAPNLSDPNPGHYNMYRYWELNGKPSTFKLAVERKMFEYNPNDKLYHANTIAWNKDTGEGEWMKHSNHSTAWMEKAFYDGYDFATDEYGEPIFSDDRTLYEGVRPILTKKTGEDLKESQEFRRNYDLVQDSLGYRKYVPKKHIEGLYIKQYDKGGYISNSPTLSYSGGGPIKRKRRNSLDWRMAVYNAIDPRTTVKNIEDAFRLYNSAVAKEKNRDTSKNYTLGNTIGDLTTDAAWRKRLLLPYDETLLPVWNGDTVSLSRPLELEIPIDTNLVKDKINYAKNEFWNDVKSLNLRQLKEDKAYKKSQEELLDALRYTYKTGKPVGISEYHANSIEPEKVLKEFKYGISPLNVLGRYNIRYDKDENKMYYSDEWDFNQYEWAVPGTSFRIRGAIPLSNKNGGFIFPNLAFSHKFEK